MDLESEIRELEAGPVLDALCATALGATPYFIDGLCHIPACDCWQDETAPFCVSRSWSAAGPALEWLAARDTYRCKHLGREDGGNWYCWLRCSGFEMGTYAADTAPLAIARAVCLVGIRERPDEMRAAWEALEGE